MSKFTPLNYRKRFISVFFLLAVFCFSGCGFFSPGRNRFGMGNPDFEVLKKTCEISASQGTVRLYLGDGGATTAYSYSVTYEDKDTEELQIFFSYSTPKIDDIACLADSVTLQGDGKTFDFTLDDIKNNFVKKPMLFYRGKREENVKM